MAKTINVYSCHRGHRMVTVDRVEGVTPFLTRCLACAEESLKVPELARSEFYNVDQNLIPHYEWYRPTDDEILTEPDFVQRHVRMGGLLLRPIGLITKVEASFK